MESQVQVAFKSEGLLLPLAKLLPLKKVNADPKTSPIFRRVLASIREVGLIEPLVVFPQAGRSGDYSVLDGNLRLEALRQVGRRDALCLVATQDEAYTYNHKVNHISPIQEHFMILKAIENGVSEERIAASLDVDVGKIRQKRDLLKGVCPEAVELLKDKHAAAGALRELRRVKPMRQIEMAELMIASHNFSSSYAKCLLAATKQEQLLEPERPKEVKGLRQEDMGRMEKEMETLSQDFKMIEESHGRNVLNLVLSVGYLRKLLDNAGVVKYLLHHHGDVLTEFQKIITATNLEGTA